ncbi:MAG: PSD1 and planctomycete cytochrome C domain-containing protein, partial [Planctomycetota bacterium]|nr:PSD1 and planctomycete cytochrome C domain-containing protein [Planctomycetota bacterium]
MFSRTLAPLLFVLLVGLFRPVLAADSIDFQRDVQPILAEHCTICHGIAESDRKSGFRLDIHEDLLRGGDSGKPAIVPGKPEESELFRRVSSNDADVIMPPPSHNKPLSARQIEIFQQWIAEGGEYESHWAFSTPKKRDIPGIGVNHPIDAFVVSHLRDLDLAPSNEADAATLCRRLYLDLIGLPPSPEQFAEFQQKGYEAVVDELLASERFGEKWARHWLDAARYSDSNGYEKDLKREQWKWRDWVIAALNRDMPYNQFLIEQIAGDMLPGATQDQVIATGFLRNSMINEEGAIIAEQFRMVEMFDRMDCIGKAVLGLSTQCAQCHTHKFDPLTHDEYYGLFAFLNNSYEAQSWVYTPEQFQQIATIEQKLTELDNRFKAEHPQWEQEFATWEQTLLQQRPEWEPLDALQVETVSGLNHPTKEADNTILMKGHTSTDVFLVAAPALDGVTGLRLEALNHRDLKFNGPGHSAVGTWGMHELEAFIKTPDGTEWEKVKLVNPTADFSEPETKSEDGKKTRGPVSLLVDGSDDTTWSTDRGVGRRNQPSVVVVQFEQPLTYPEGTKLKLAWRMDSMLGYARFGVTRQAAPSVPAIDHAVMLALDKPAAERTDADQTQIFRAWRSSLDGAKAINDEAEALWKTYPVAETSILHLMELNSADPRPTFSLDRGNWDQPLQEVVPHVPAALHSFPEDAPRNRLGFAHWLADERSPLTARVAVNRVWQAIFGLGLVETPEDFGTRAPIPEYRELLDWLAVDFMENGWSQKQLIRTIVTSATYRQSSHATPELRERDVNNVLLARGPRFRAEAEVVRDIALTVSGLITHKIGGPSVIPPVPKNVLDYNFVVPTFWTPAEGPERYRRAVYGFRKRSMPDPVMTNFDAPNADFACARRVRSNTPLAALTSLNEPIFVESARALALRVLNEGGINEPQRIARAFELCTLRQPTPEE